MIKQCNHYYISVEGETEIWYLNHLKYLINHCNEAIYKVSYTPKKNIHPLNFIKATSIVNEATAFHICDYESNDDCHVSDFKAVLKELKDARKLKKKLNYSLGYCNYAFELWIVLHKKQLCGSLCNRKKYILSLNNAYNTKFKSIKDYKKEVNFKRILEKINMDDVKQAIANAKESKKQRKNNGDKKSEYMGFNYYRDNPDLTIDECVEKILNEAGITTER